MIVKVKEPLEPEVERLRPGQILFTYLHLAPAPELTRGLCASGATVHRLRDRRGSRMGACRCWHRCPR